MPELVLPALILAMRVLALQHSVYHAGKIITWIIISA